MNMTNRESGGNKEPYFNNIIKNTRRRDSTIKENENKNTKKNQKG